MNWKLIFLLSLFGVAMGVASLFGFTRGIEPLSWLLIFLLYAWWIAKNAPGKYFLHGFLVSVLNGIWISIIHCAFFSLYVKNNPEMLEGFSKLPASLSPRLMMLIIGPIVGVLFGVVAGLFALVGAKIVRRKV
ncbi:MAG: hypothetical protein M3R52_08085 [Acidobacteriota bacterium]|nr:hypothetical protein [Acidobacteriota bacterium]